MKDALMLLLFANALVYTVLAAYHLNRGNNHKEIRYLLLTAICYIAAIGVKVILS